MVAYKEFLALESCFLILNRQVKEGTKKLGRQAYIEDYLPDIYWDESVYENPKSLLLQNL